MFIISVDSPKSFFTVTTLPRLQMYGSNMRSVQEISKSVSTIDIRRETNCVCLIELKKIVPRSMPGGNGNFCRNLTQQIGQALSSCISRQCLLQYVSPQSNICLRVHTVIPLYNCTE
jgi:hypothetical protein